MDKNETNEINLEVTIEDIVELFNSTDKKKMKAIKEEICSKRISDTDLFTNSESRSTLEKGVEQAIKSDKTRGDESYLIFSNGFYKKRRKKSPDIKPVADSNYFGKAGECAVMSELLFNGYNVNNMMVDEGVDIVASKDNVFYYIQVKTKSADDKNRFYFQIKQERFNDFVGAQMRYFLVGRVEINKVVKNIYFMFGNNDISRLMYGGYIPVPAEGAANLSIKIEFDTRTGKAYIYDRDKRSDISYYMNNFKL